MGFKTGIFLTAGVASILLIAQNTGLDQQLIRFGGQYGSMAIALISLLIAAFAIWRLINLQKKLSRLQDGLDRFERHLNERFDALPKQNSGAGFEHQSLPISNPNQILNELDVPLQARFDFDAPPLPEQHEDLNNVVPFLRLVQSGSEKARSKSKATNISFDRSSFHLRLQPIVDLQSRRAAAFEIIPGFTNREGEFLPLEAVKTELGDAFSAADCDLQLIRSATTLLKPMKTRAGSTQFYLQLSAEFLVKPKLFSEFLSVLQRNKGLADQLILGVDQTKLGQLKRAAQNRLVDLSDLGFKLALTGCRNLTAAQTQVEERSFESLQVCNTVLEQLEVSTTFSADIETLRNAARAGMKIIVKNINEERQVLRLLDRYIPFASGPFFSEPKLPAMETKTTTSAEG